MSDNVKAGSLPPAGPQLLPAATQAAASPADCASALFELARHLASNQVQLDPGTARVLYENRWELYG